MSEPHMTNPADLNALVERLETSAILDLYPQIRMTNRAHLGFHASILDASDCPLGHGICAPVTGPNCDQFMGHLFKGREAFLGQAVPVCCAILLRRALALNPKETDQ